MSQQNEADNNEHQKPPCINGRPQESLETAGIYNGASWCNSMIRETGRPQQTSGSLPGGGQGEASQIRTIF